MKHRHDVNLDDDYATTIGHPTQLEEKRHQWPEVLMCKKNGQKCQFGAILLVGAIIFMSKSSHILRKQHLNEVIHITTIRSGKGNGKGNWPQYGCSGVTTLASRCKYIAHHTNPLIHLNIIKSQP